MKPFTNEEMDAFKNALSIGRECYSAFNRLAVKTNMDFRFYSIDLYNAINVLQAIVEYQEKEEK